MRTTVRLPEDLLARAKRKAAAEGRTVTSYLEEGLRLVLAGQPRPARRGRKQPRLCGAGGGPAPGIDLTSTAALQEFDDLAHRPGRPR